MRLRNLMAMISTVNDYSPLKWPLIIISVSTTLLALLLLLSFRSDAWFTYKSVQIDYQTTTLDTTSVRPRLLEYGSFGLWLLCVGHSKDSELRCDQWTRETRPQNFSVLLALLTCALFITNLTIFPSWASTILILYNTHNRYIRPIVAFTLTLFVLFFIITAILICVMILVGLTKFYAPSTFIIRTYYLSFYCGSGLYYLLFSTILAVICFLLIIITLVWKKWIEMRLIEQEKDLLRQLADDDYQPGWHKVIMVPRRPSATDDDHGEPPPYSRHNEETNN